MSHEELRDHPDLAGILYMTGLCKHTLIWTHVHTHYQVTRSGIRAGRVRACACLHARLATAASHARRLAARLPGDSCRPHSPNGAAIVPLGGGPGGNSNCSHADRETVGRWGGITQDSRSARDIDAASVLVPANAAEGSKRVISSRETHPGS